MLPAGATPEARTRAARWHPRRIALEWQNVLPHARLRPERFRCQWKPLRTLPDQDIRRRDFAPRERGNDPSPRDTSACRQFHRADWPPRAADHDVRDRLRTVDQIDDDKT